MASVEREPIMGSGVEPPAGSMGTAPGQGVGRGPSPLKLKTFYSKCQIQHIRSITLYALYKFMTYLFLAFGCPTEAANLPHSPYLENSLNPRYM